MGFPSRKLPSNKRLSDVAGRRPTAEAFEMTSQTQTAVIGVVTASDRASAGVYQDESGPAIEAYFRKVLTTPLRIERRVIPDGFESVRDTLIDLADTVGCDLIVTTGGTGPSPRDLTPEATLAAAPRELPGFGELMRKVSLEQVPTAILSRQLAAHRGKCLVINLPGKPAAIEMCLDAVMPAVPYCLDLIGAAWIDTDPALVKAFRPKGK
jgi:molybdopterin adenylyltransferase